MPRKHCKKITEKEAERLLKAYPGWVGRTGILFNISARNVQAVSTWRAKLKQTDPERFKAICKEDYQKRLLRSCGVLPSSPKKGRQSAKASVLEHMAFN